MREEAKPNQEAREFVVPKSDFSVIELFNAAKMIKNCVEQGTPPSCNVRGEALCASCREYPNASN